MQHFIVFDRCEIGISRNALGRTRRQQSRTFDDFGDYKCSFALTSDEYTSELPRNAFAAITKEEETQIGISRNALGRTRRQQSRTFDDFGDYKCSFALTSDEYTSELPRNAFAAITKEEETQIGISRNALGRTRRQQSRTFDDFDDYKCSFALTSDEYTSELPRDAFAAIINEEETQIGISRNALGRTRRQQSRTFDDFDDYKCSFALTSDEYTSELPRDAFAAIINEEETQFGIVHWSSVATRDDSTIEPMIDCDLNFEEWT
ncbi:hypothetical protein V1478_018626 [Vespula squamosa]|uniref:Uncharacterized protein n=1 Tax=Vespula squamosa TaxID=30214 RepID=A0ABD1ZVS7_VESSQ